MAKGCWCSLKFHIPGEKKRHQKIQEETDKLLGYKKTESQKGKK